MWWVSTMSGIGTRRGPDGPNTPANSCSRTYLRSSSPVSAMRYVIVASPPCQNYSYLAMPWSRSKDPNNSKAAKALRRKWETEGPDNRLFDACFRIQREAIEATRNVCRKCNGCGMSVGCPFCEPDGRTAARYIPLIVENVRGAQPWVGRSAWNYGSFHLWGDVPALMPINLKRGQKVPAYSGPAAQRR